MKLSNATFISLLLIFFTALVHADTTWTTGTYSNNENINKTLSIPNATKLIVTITGETESKYDFIDIYDNNGRMIKRLDGTINEEFTVNGSSITARLRSDYSITKSGVTVTIKEANEPPPSSIITWTTGAYKNNVNVRQILSIANATKLIVTVKGETERWFDIFYIYNSNGRMIKRLDGTINEEFTVNGASITARLRSDYSITKSGVTVSIREDKGGNADTVKPVITLLGNANITLTVGDTYNDAGATASDNVDGNITANIAINNPIDTNTTGTYTITYNVNDAAGNSADEVTRTVVVERDKVYAFFADEHNDQTNPATGTGTGNRILQVDLENMSIVNTLNLPGILGHHVDNTYNSKVYGVPKGSTFVNVVPLKRGANNTINMTNTKQIPLTFKPRSGDAYNSKYNIVLMVASNRPMGAFINVETDEVVGTVGEEIDCTLTDGSQLLSHADANTAEGALKYQCARDAQSHGGEQISGHPYWLTDDIAAIVDRSNNQISTYRINQVGTQIQATLLNRITTRTSIHQIVPRDRTGLPAHEQMDYYAVEEGIERVSANDYIGGVAHALIHLRLTPGGLTLERRINLERTEVLPKAKADRILSSCVTIYRSTFTAALNGPSQEREDRYNALFAQEGITRSTDQDRFNDFPVDCFYPGIPGGHNADFAPNNKHLYIGMAGGAMSVVDVNRWKIVNNIDIGLQAGPGHMCFSQKHDVGLSSNHGFSDTFNNRGMTRSIRYINSERPIGYYWIAFPFDRKVPGDDIAVSHSCYVDESGDNYYNFSTNAGIFYKIDLSQVFNNPRNGVSTLVVDTLDVGGEPIQGSYIHSNTIQKGN